ncbi:MAG TPA: antitoxin VapB family protein [Candidatus Binatus sp.]|nr:antitoxin VapB family protein [Candidatus Binatus sp.]
MAHKTLTISEEAYNALVKRRTSEAESFTRVILRLTNDQEKSSAGRLLEYIQSMPPADELANKLEEIVEKRKTISLRAART